jgi:hypothetical protein
MTDEDRQELCKILRTMEPWPCKQAADELERLAQRLAELEQRDRNIANDIRALARWI